MGKRNSCHPATVEWLGHFRVNPSLCFKARLSAKQMIWNMIFLFWWRWNSLSQKGFAFMMSCIVGFLSNRTRVLGELLFIFKTYYKILQFTTARLITIYDNVLLQFTIAWLLQFSTTVITIYDDYYYNSRQNKLRVTQAYAVQVWLVGKWEYQKPQKDTNLGRSCTYSFIWSLKDT